MPSLIKKGLRVFTCGHSFHFWVPEILAELAGSAGIKGHQIAGISAIGGSRMIQHWDVPDEQNEAKTALKSGSVDVLTLTCMTHPDEGIRTFAHLAVEHNPGIRVTFQELWLPEDHFPFDAANRTRSAVEEFDKVTMADLKRPHQAYCTEMEAYITAVNAELGRTVVFIVPDAQAAMALRGRIMVGEAPGLTKQSELFTDAWGHPQPVLKLLSAYTHFSVIYRRDPAGLPWPASTACEQQGDELNRLLQRIAWEAVTGHPMSGVQ